MEKAAAWLKRELNYEFQDTTLLERALTHRSAPGRNNERLEFLGDAILQLVVTEYLFGERTDASEGRLSRLRSSLVKDSTLAELAVSLGIGEFIVLGPGERKSGGHRRQSILADAVEALFGAVYLESGIDAARAVIFAAFGDRIDNLPRHAELRDPKSRLQEYLQARGMALPIYETEQVSGKAHRQRFEVRCAIAGLERTTAGRGTSRREAEQEAAQAMLDVIESGT